MIKTDKLLWIPANMRGPIAICSLAATVFIAYQILFSSNGSDLYNRLTVAGIGLFGVALAKRSDLIRNFCRRFFTVRTIVAVVALCFIAAFLFPKLAKARFSKDHDSPMTRIDRLGIAFTQYIQEYGELPQGNRTQIMEAMAPYVNAQEHWADSPRGRPLSLWNYNPSQYFSLNTVVFQAPKSAFRQHERETVLAFAPESNNFNGEQKRIVLFLDGHREAINESSFVLFRQQTMSLAVDQMLKK